MYLAILKSVIVEAKYKIQHILPIVMEGDARVEHDNEYWTYCESNSRLDNQRGQAFYMIRGQWMQVILDKMKHDPDWDNTSESYYPLIILNIIDKNILAQTKYQYLYATVYNQECALYGFNQHNLTNEQHYERLNTKVDVVEAIGITG